MTLYARQIEDSGLAGGDVVREAEAWVFLYVIQITGKSSADMAALEHRTEPASRRQNKMGN